MSLVHPIVDPQIALRACRGCFFGTSEEYVALLYSDRVVFRRIAPPGDVVNDADILSEPELEISIPQPPMTLGNADKNILPNVGGLFFAVGRNRDMLVMQYAQYLAVLSVNTVDQLLQLQGMWGLPRPKESHSHPSLAKAASAASLVSLVDNSSISAPRSGLSLVPSLPPAVPSPDGTQIFLASRSKSGSIVLLVLNCFAKESIRHDAEYMNVLTLGWLTDEIVYFVYVNSKFHKKFQTCRLISKQKQGGFLGMGRKQAKAGFAPECNVAIALDFVPAVPDLNGGSDLVFKDYVLLGTREGGYIRVNFKGSGSWEHVPNAKNVVGALLVSQTALIVQKTNGPRPRASSGSQSHPLSQVVPTSANQFTYSIVSDGTVHAIRGDPLVGACLCSKHNVDGDKRFKLKLLSLGNGYVLDFKRQPLRIFKVTSRPTARIDCIPSGSSLGDITPLVTSKESCDFLVKTAAALYTRDPNGDDMHVWKIIDRNTSMRVPLDRPGLVKIAKRDSKSVWAAFSSAQLGSATPSGLHVVPSGATYFPEIRVLEESHKSVTRLKTKATFQFGNQAGRQSSIGSGNYSQWCINRLTPIHKGVVLVGLASKRVSNRMTWSDDAKWCQNNLDGPQFEWAVFLLVFVGSTSKHNPVQPKAHLLLTGSSPEVAPEALKCPGTPNQFIMGVFNAQKQAFTSLKKLSVNKVGEFKFQSLPSKVIPYSLSQNPSASFFTDLNGPLGGVYLAGRIRANEEGTVHELVDILQVDALKAEDGVPVLLEGKTLDQSTIWLFDSNGAQFREFTVQEVPENRKQQLYRQEQIIADHIRRHDVLSRYHLSPIFRARFFSPTTVVSQFRPLNELDIQQCEGVGAGVDAEVYLKTPDAGYYAMFRIQNKRLRDSLTRLEKVILSKRVASWLPEPIKSEWLESLGDNSMITATLFGAYWRLDEEQRADLCEEADVSPELMNKVRPP